MKGNLTSISPRHIRLNPGKLNGASSDRNKAAYSRSLSVSDFSLNSVVLYVYVDFTPDFCLTCKWTEN